MGKRGGKFDVSDSVKNSHFYSTRAHDGGGTPAPLSPWGVVVFLVVFLGLFSPIAYWMGWNRPALFDLRGEGYPVPWAEFLTVVVAAWMFVVPLAWIYVGRAIDLLSLTICLNALILVGYFYLDITGPKIFGAERAVLDAGNMTLALNAIGFFVMLAVLAGTYALLALSRRGLKPMAGSAEDMDSRLRWFLYPAMIMILGMIAAPMLLTGMVPMLSGDPMEGRMILQRSNLGRPLYNLASSVLPAVTASCIILALRRKTLLGRIFNIEVLLVGMVLVTQFLTSNRLPLAITLLTTFSLFTLEKKFPRLLLPLLLVGFVTLYLGLSGFSAILRQNREVLESGQNIVLASLSEAFVGNNLADLRDGAWVIGEWNFEPLNGKTYLGGVASLLPSALFPAKKEAYLGLVALDIVQWPTEEHFGLRLSFFVESFLNFGLAGVVGLGVILGAYSAYNLRQLHLSAMEEHTCLTRNLRLILMLQLGLTLANSSEGFVAYSILALFLGTWLLVDLPLRWKTGGRVPVSKRGSLLLRG